MPSTEEDRLVKDALRKARRLLGRSDTPVADSIRQNGYPYWLKYSGTRDDN